MDLESTHRCPACRSRLQRLPETSKPQGRRCIGCGLLVVDASTGAADKENMLRHYRAVDPHEQVALSKAAFFQEALRCLDSKVARTPRRLVDIGCGFGYFLEKAQAAGWEAAGVDIVPEAVLRAKSRLPAVEVFLGDLRGARFPSESVDAATLWDVLCHVEDPPAELKECHRILSPGGFVGIRLRNVETQLWLSHWYSRLSCILRRLGVKPLHVFHRYNFSRTAIERLLAGNGFVDITVCNSPLTSGDPYACTPIGASLKIAKLLGGAMVEAVYRLTCGRMLIGPSLLVWARKP
ncbi:MAG: class I SAM-dependent methyltransferase [Desulfobacteraceae bacterium]|nr:MAG: class I SAM-dependent methyltransferase [Desulfobacteraceae bacterium]